MRGERSMASSDGLRFLPRSFFVVILAFVVASCGGTVGRGDGNPASQPAAAPVESAPAETEVAETLLSAIANRAAAYEGGKLSNVRFTKTTLFEAFALMQNAAAGFEDEPVYLVQAEGNFIVTGVPAEAAPINGTAYYMVLEMDTYRLVAEGVAARPLDLASLGGVEMLAKTLDVESGSGSLPDSWTQTPHQPPDP